MSRTKAAACLAIGLAAGVLLAPTGALSAVPTLVRITDTGSHAANVTKAHQLLAAESDPAAAVLLSAGAPASCVPVYTVPAGKALVMKTATFDLQMGSTQTNGNASLRSGSDCGGATWANEWATGANTTATLTDDLGSTSVLPAGTELDFYNGGFLYAYVTVHGYLIPAAAAPKGTVVVTHGTPRLAPVK